MSLSRILSTLFFSFASTLLFLGFSSSSYSVSESYWLFDSERLATETTKAKLEVFKLLPTNAISEEFSPSHIATINDYIKEESTKKDSPVGFFAYDFNTENPKDIKKIQELLNKVDMGVIDNYLNTLFKHVSPSTPTYASSSLPNEVDLVYASNNAGIGSAVFFLTYLSAVEKLLENYKYQFSSLHIVHNGTNARCINDALDAIIRKDEYGNKFKLVRSLINKPRNTVFSSFDNDSLESGLSNVRNKLDPYYVVIGPENIWTVVNTIGDVKEAPTQGQHKSMGAIVGVSDYAEHLKFAAERERDQQTWAAFKADPENVGRMDITDEEKAKYSAGIEVSEIENNIKRSMFVYDVTRFCKNLRSDYLSYAGPTHNKEERFLEVKNISSSSSSSSSSAPTPPAPTPPPAPVVSK